MRAIQLSLGAKLSSQSTPVPGIQLRQKEGAGRGSPGRKRPHTLYRAPALAHLGMPGTERPGRSIPTTPTAGARPASDHGRMEAGGTFAASDANKEALVEAVVVRFTYGQHGPGRWFRFQIPADGHCRACPHPFSASVVNRMPEFRIRRRTRKQAASSALR